LPTLFIHLSTGFVLIGRSCQRSLPKWPVGFKRSRRSDLPTTIRCNVRSGTISYIVMPGLSRHPPSRTPIGLW
jgi:hypothetical protein